MVMASILLYYNYSLNVYLQQTGEIVAVHGAVRPSNSRKQWSGTQQLSRWNQLYVVRWGDQNSLLRLQAAIYSPYSPAATYNWTSPLFGDRDPGLYAAQRRGILLHATYEPNSVRRLEPSTLKPMWGIPEVGSYDQVYISTFIEDIFLVVSTAPSAPFINVVTAFSLEFGTALWKWTTTSQVASAFIYSGTAVDRKTGNQRLCGRLVQLASKTPEERLLCIEPWSARVTLNVTLRCSSDLAYPKAEFMVRSSRKYPSVILRLHNTQAIYDTWALVKDTASGNLLALSCFNPTEASLATPSWVFPNQRDLSSVTVSEDGLSYLIASYKPYVNNAFRSAIARWDRNATLGL